MDYSNACIYKIVCKDTSITDCYVGSTVVFKSRTKQHKSSCNNENDKNHNMNVYEFIREHGGWDNWIVILVEKVNVNDSYELHKEERKYIEQLNATLNQKIPTRNKKEWYEINKDKYKEYYENNKEKRNEKRKEYYQANKKKELEQQKEYYELNKDKIKAKVKEKVNCPICNTFIRKDGLSRHQKTIKCLTIKNNI